MPRLTWTYSPTVHASLMLDSSPETRYVSPPTFWSLKKPAQLTCVAFGWFAFCTASDRCAALTPAPKSRARHNLADFASIANSFGHALGHVETPLCEVSNPRLCWSRNRVWVLYTFDTACYISCFQ